MAQDNFKSLFCERYQVEPEKFESRLLSRCLPFHARLFASVLIKLKSKLFAQELEFVHYLGFAATRRDVRAELDTLTYERRVKPSAFKNFFRLGVSSSKVLRLGNDLFPGSPVAGKTAGNAVSENSE